MNEMTTYCCQQRLLLPLAFWLLFAPELHRLSAQEQPALPDLTKPSWIWLSDRALSDGEFAVFFRKSFELPTKATRATVLITADNGYDLFVNGSLIGGDAGFDGIFWSSVEKYPVEHLLQPGRNVVAVRGENMGGPAGLLAAARIEFEGGKFIELFTDNTWRTSQDVETTWTSTDFDDSKWTAATALGSNGMAPWGKVTFPGPVSPQHSGRGGSGVLKEPGKDFRFPSGVLFLRGRVPQSSTPGAPQSIWPIGGSRAYLEFDTPGPATLGTKLYSLVPARPDSKPRLLLDAGKGVLGSPSVSFDGRTIYVSLAPGGESFFHVYGMNADGSNLRPLTNGPFHDFDPEPLPDGRIVFSSTRVGSREEYHGNIGRSLFTMKGDGSDIRPLTYHIVGDNEPKVTAEGEVAFIRCDNFMERAKVETQVHLVHPDGTNGRVLFGANRETVSYDRVNAAEGDSRWLRSYGFGSIAPLTDGRVACISANGLAITGSDPAKAYPLQSPVGMFDLSPLPEGRLLCTTASRGVLAVLDPNTGDAVSIFKSDTYDLLSATYLGPRPKPPVVASHLMPNADRAADKSGYLLCQNVFYSKQKAADRARIKAVRVLEGRPFTNRSARHPYDHIGVEAVELGTVPLAPDGSFYVKVPADKALAVQLVDGEGRAVLNEMTWIYVRPGERRTCTGCHEGKRNAPLNREALAFRAGALSLMGKSFPLRFRGNNAANGGILNLQFDRFREAASINLHSELRTSESVPNRSSLIRELCAVFSGGREADRVSALQKLAVFRDRTAVPSLLQALRDPSADVRMAAALALSACGTREAIQALLEALDDSSPPVAQAVSVALENLTGHTEAFNPYQNGAQNRGSSWRSWFQQTSWEAIETELTARLTSRDPATVQKAVEALGHLGGEEGKAALRSFLSKTSDQSLTALLAAIRGLGHLHDAGAVPLLAAVLKENMGMKEANPLGSPEYGWLQRPVHLAAAAAEALGWIGTREAEKILIEVVPQLQPFWYYTSRTGDHGWLMGCHSSVLHYRILEALDAMGTTDFRSLVPHLLRSIPIDTDRALLFENDSYEMLVRRVVNRSGAANKVLQACLKVLGDEQAGGDGEPAVVEAVTASPPAESVGPLGRDSRAAQIASIVCMDPQQSPRLCAAFDRYRAQPPSRERSWTCFYLARALGNLGDKSSINSLIAALQSDPTEASYGYESPPNVFIYKAMTPFYRAAAAYALGEIGDGSTVLALLKTVENMDNALEVRYASARALQSLFAGSSAVKTEPSISRRLEALGIDYPEITTGQVLRETWTALKSQPQAATDQTDHGS
ncbi:MAG: HEAT repeat domain-containing protein [Armatimonadetes bacterium]|nr:HEAT repeat domain-containing protein [Armatimonadota bacterium]